MRLSPTSLNSKKCPSFLLNLNKNTMKTRSLNTSSSHLQNTKKLSDNLISSRSIRNLGELKRVGREKKSMKAYTQDDKRIDERDMNQQPNTSPISSKQQQKSYQNESGEIFCIKVRTKKREEQEKKPTMRVNQRALDEGLIKKIPNKNLLFKSSSAQALSRAIQQKKSTNLTNLSNSNSQIQSLFASQKQSVISNFNFVRILGKGTTAKVHLVQHRPTCTLYALKVIHKSVLQNSAIKDSIQREMKNSWRVKDPNVVQLYDVFDDAIKIYLLMEYLEDGTLYDYWQSKKRKIEQKTAIKFVKDICQGLSSLHHLNIIHRDLKLQNIMLQHGVAKIGDLGCSIQTKVMRQSIIGSPVYSSPEQLSHHMYNHKVDTWSLGIITFQLLFSYSPFEKDIYEIMVNGTTKYPLPHIKFPDFRIVSPDVKSFINQLLQHDIEKRLDVNEAMNHPFLNKNNYNELLSHIN